MRSLPEIVTVLTTILDPAPTYRRVVVVSPPSLRTSTKKWAKMAKQIPRGVRPSVRPLIVWNHSSGPDSLKYKNFYRNCEISSCPKLRKGSMAYINQPFLQITLWFKL